MIELILIIPAFLKMAGCSLDITPDTITAIIQVESGWNQSAVSGWNAVGLMQVTPVAVEDYNRRRGTDITLYDVGTEPIINLMVGIDHLCQWDDLDKRGKIITYFTGRKRFLEMEWGEADYLIRVANIYYGRVIRLESVPLLVKN